MLQVQIDDHVAVLTLDRPEVRNAINTQMATALDSAFDHVDADDSIWIAILAGSGPVFCAGADLKEVAAREHRAPARPRGLGGLTRRHRRKPLIAAVEGPAIAGGCELVAACDLVVASTEAYFAITEVKRGFVAIEGALWRLPRKLPANVVMRMALTEEPLPAVDAHAHGFVNELVSPGTALDAARALASTICANAPIAVQQSRRLIEEAPYLDDPSVFALADDAHAAVQATADFTEGPRAFVEKRPPRWTGH